MPWMLLRYGLPLVAGLGLIWAVKHHFDEHQRLQFNNVELTQAVEAKDAAITRYRDEIRRRDSILARHAVVNRQLSQRIRDVESVVTQSDDQESIDWGNSDISPVVFSGLYQVSHNKAGSHQAETPSSTDDDNRRAETERQQE
jgi:hypothetical protein